MQLQGKEHRARATQGGQSPTLESQQSRLEFSRLNLSFGQLTVFNFMKSSIKILFKIWFQAQRLETRFYCIVQETIFSIL